MFVTQSRRRWAYLTAALLVSTWCLWPEKTTVSVTVLGAVKNPGRIELLKSANLEDALAAAGGWDGSWPHSPRPPHVMIIQKRSGDKEADLIHIGMRMDGKKAFHLNYEDEKRIQIQDGWVIRVPEVAF